MGYAFENYIASLKQTRDLEAETEARKAQRNSLIVQNIANAGVGIVQAFQKNKAMEQEAKQAYMSVGAPGANQVKTPTDQKAMELQNRVDAIKSGIDAHKVGFTTEDLSGQLDKNIEKYNKQLNDLNNQLSQIDTYKRTPQYQQERIDAGFNQFIGNDLNNRSKLMNAYADQKEEARYQKNAGRELDMFRKKAEITSGSKASSGADYDKKKKYIDEMQGKIDDLSKDFMSSDDDKNAKKQILSSGMNAISSAKDINTVEKAYSGTLASLNSYKTPDNGVKPVPKKETWSEKRARQKIEKQKEKEKDDKPKQVQDMIDNLASKYTK
jgi:hypothetical protein